MRSLVVSYHQASRLPPAVRRALERTVELEAWHASRHAIDLARQAVEADAEGRLQDALGCIVQAYFEAHQASVIGWGWLLGDGPAPEGAR